MNTETQKSAITVVGGEKVPARLIEVINLLVEKAFSMTGKGTDNVCINFLENTPKKKENMLFSTFSAPNVININLQKHLDQMADMADTVFMRSSNILWYELLRSVGHELHHMLLEYVPFTEAYDHNLEALQIGITYNCTKAEAWGAKLVLATGFEHNIDPPEEWATGVMDEDMLSIALCAWQCALPDIGTTWAKRQQEMIDRNIAWLDDEEAPEITLDNFSDWLAIEGNWETPVWKVRLEDKIEDIVVEEEPVVVDDVIEVEEAEVIVVEEEPVVVEPTPEPEQSIPAIDLMVQSPVNPTLAEMKSVMYYTFMAVYDKIYDNCGWEAGGNGFSFTTPAAIECETDISHIPYAPLVVVNYGIRGGSNQPVWPNGVLHGMTFINGTIPAVKIGIRTVSGKVMTYTAVAQNPQKESSWGKSAKAGVKSLVIFREGGDNNSDIAVRILDGQFISNPLGLNGGQATVVTADML